MHALSQCQVTFICQRGVHEFLSIALILIGVVELGIDHTDDRSIVLEIESQLFLPQPVKEILHTLVLQLLDDIHIMNGVHDQCFVLQISDLTFDGIGSDLNIGVLFQDLLNFWIESVELSVTNCFLSSFGEENPFCEAQNLKEGKRSSSIPTKVSISQTCDGYFSTGICPICLWESCSALINSCCKVANISFANSFNHSSTEVVIRIFLANGTSSPSRERMARMCWLASSNWTEWMPAKSFFKCDWITVGLVDWPRISRRSSSPMK